MDDPKDVAEAAREQILDAHRTREVDGHHPPRVDGAKDWPGGNRGKGFVAAARLVRMPRGAVGGDGEGN